MTKTIQVCPQCGSDNVSGIAIVELNTLRILHVEYQEGALCGACGQTEILTSSPNDADLHTPKKTMQPMQTAPPDRAVPSSTTLNAIWGFGAKDIWTAGENGVALHWPGSRWTMVPTGAKNHLRGLWGAYSKDLWAVGKEEILHWDGTAWRTSAVKPRTGLWDIWGYAPDKIWAVGRGGFILHWDGAGWTEVASGTDQDLNGIWGFSPDDIWVVGDQETLLRWDGKQWKVSRQHLRGDFTDV